MKETRLTDLAWKVLEAAEDRPLIEFSHNPGTVWALVQKGYIVPAPYGTHAITDAGIALLRQREKEIAADMVEAGRTHLNNGRPTSE